MSSTALPASRAKARTFYVWMAGYFFVVAAIGFGPTYWLAVPAGTFAGAPLIHGRKIVFAQADPAKAGDQRHRTTVPPANLFRF